MRVPCHQRDAAGAQHRAAERGKNLHHVREAAVDFLASEDAEEMPVKFHDPARLGVAEFLADGMHAHILRKVELPGEHRNDIDRANA